MAGFGSGVRLTGRAHCVNYREGDVSRADGVFLNHPKGAVVTWDRTSKAVWVEWLGWADSTEFSALHEAGLRVLTEHQGSRWLADCRNQKAIQQTDPDWVRDWFRRALAAGLRRMAVVITKSGMARMNVEDILRRVPGTELAVGYFTTVEEAREWLTGPLNVPATGPEVKSTS